MPPLPPMASESTPPLAPGATPKAGCGVVVVTGASSGIGRATALHLAELGHVVLAGVRDHRSHASLSELGPRVVPVMLDIRRAAEIAQVAELVDRVAPDGLTGLVNNAGIALAGPTEVLDPEDWRMVMDINLIGAVALTRALLPSLLRAGGRVVNIGSAGGRVALPLFGPYAASKFAMEAFTDSLRREVEPHGMKVVCIRPGVVRSAMAGKGLELWKHRGARMSPEQEERYGALLDSALGSADDPEGEASAPIGVALVVARALSVRRPRTRYACGTDGRMAVLGARVLPDRVMDRILARMTR